MSQQTQVNGNRFSFVNVQVFALNGYIPKGVFKSINYSSQQDPGIVQGNQIGIVGRTAGYGTSTGSFEMLRAELDDFFYALTGGGVFSIMNPPQDFDIIVNYAINEIDTVTDTLKGCRITKIDSNNQQGNDATTKTCDLNISQILLGGIPTYADVAR